MSADFAHARLTPDQFKALAKYKGWKFKALAERWGVTPEWISTISRDPQRDVRYDDALLGLPNLRRLSRDLKIRSRQVEAAMQKAGAVPRPVKPVRPEPGYRYRGYLYPGAIVAASDDVGSIAELGMRGIVFQVLDEPGKGERYGVIFETGLWDWFTPDYVDLYLATTGLTATTNEHYIYRDEALLQQDFADGLFQFWPSPE